MKFKKGDTVKCKAGIYAGRSVEIVDIHAQFNPCAYSCSVWNHKKNSMIDILLFENEMETIYEHDMRAHNLCKEVK